MSPPNCSGLWKKYTEQAGLNLYSGDYCGGGGGKDRFLRLLRKVKATIATIPTTTAAAAIGKMNPDELEDFTETEEDETGEGEEVGSVKGSVEGADETAGCELEPIGSD